MDKHQRMLFAARMTWGFVIAFVILLFVGLIALILNTDTPLGVRLIAAGFVGIIVIEVVTVLLDRDGP